MSRSPRPVKTWLAAMIFAAFSFGAVRGAYPQYEVRLPEPASSSHLGFIRAEGPDLKNTRIVGSELILPRDVSVVLSFSPSDGIRPFVEHVQWRGFLVGGERSSTNAHLAATRPGESLLELRVSIAPDPAHGTPAKTVTRQIRVRVLDTPVSQARVEITYPQGASTPPIDLSGDFAVNKIDRDLFWSGYGESRGTPGYRSLADWDADGSVDLADLVRFINAYDTWAGRESGPSYGSGLVFPVTLRPHTHAFPVPAPIFEARTYPEGLEWWVNWDVDGKSTATGAVFSRPFEEPGRFSIAASLPFAAAAAPERRELTIFRTRLANFDSGHDRLRDGVEYTFKAETDPPGFEDYVTWYADTVHGTARPEHGRGPEFTVSFTNTKGPDGFQWLGVQADNTIFSQDQAQIIGIGFAFNEADVTGPARVSFLYDDTYLGVIDEDDVILNYRGVSVSTGQDVGQAIMSLPDLTVGEDCTMTIVKAIGGATVVIHPLAIAIAAEIDTDPVNFQDRKCKEVTEGGKKKYFCRETSVGEVCILKYRIRVKDDKTVGTKTICIDSNGSKIGDEFCAK